MKKLARIMRTATLYVATLLLIGGYPLVTVAAADDPPAATTTTSVTPPAKPKTTYTYDKASGHWNTNAWVYNPATNQYEPVTIPATPVPAADSPQVITPTTPTTSTAKTPDVAPASSVPQSTTSAASDTAAKTTTSVDSTANATAKTGDASVTKNTTAGSATTGDATSTATLLNTVNSQLSMGSNQQAANFVANITGDVTGDIVLQPMLLKAMLEAGASGAGTTSTATSSTTNQITNNVNLGAQSGNATVSGNTQAGNATSGSANTVANVVNIINSMVAANQSFTGTINIYGNLNGDILIAPGFIPQLLASNGGAASNTPAQAVSATDTQSIINNVSLAAASGQAAVLGNTQAGSATSGPSKTNTVIFNLSGHQIVASNSLLVFVNVLGTWVGVIVDAPAGTTAAAIGNGVTTNTINTPSLVVSSDTNNQITNNINLQSQSGDALVTGNTSAGNATSGSATASANIANISNSDIGLTGWFGIVMINVFGNWNGSFGVNTSAGDAPARSVATNTALEQPVAFVPRGTLGAPQRIVVTQPATVITRGSDGTYQQATTTSQPAILTSVQKPASQPSAPLTMVREGPQGADYRLPIALGSIAVIGGSIIGLRRLLRG